MNRKEEILNRLYSLHRFGIKPGLERTLKLLDYIGNPHLKFPSIHVAGTNGKGSICSMIASILMEAGYKTGLYTSPHLIKFNERIRINKQNISDDEMVDSAEKLLVGTDKWECTFFEITTAMAFDYFAQNHVEIAIIETGLGGRFDSTNVLNPLLSIISSIDYDHKEYLGNTLDEIAFEKAGIIKLNTPVIITDNNPQLKTVFEGKASEEKAKVYYSSNYCEVFNNEFLPDFTQKMDVKTHNTILENIKLDLPGEHQIENIRAALKAIELIRNKFTIEKKHIINGLKNVKFNTGLISRIEFMNHNLNNPIILDSGHNPGAILKLIETLKLHRPDIQKWCFVYGAMADKDIHKVLEIIKDVCDELILTKPDIDRAADLKALKNYALELGFIELHTYEKVSEAVEFSLTLVKPTVIGGSFYLAGEAIPVLNKLLKEFE